MATYSATSTGRTGTIQSWTVSTAGRYKIECWGAQGATGNAGAGGLGAYRYGEMTLAAGEVIKIIVGQSGVRSGNNYEGGGGGGSFVYRETGSELLCAAGGGGGSSQNGVGVGGTTATSGTQGGNSGGAGGTNGSGGLTGTNGAAGGGGWNATGTSSYGSVDYCRPGSACKPGATYDTSSGGQAYGGYNGAGTAPYPVGGFGGGASAHGNNYVGGGGGGGYSGGGGANSSGYGGGGGGSFVHASMSNTGGTAGARSGHGQVVITLLNDPPTATITNPTAGQKIDPRLPLQMTWSYADLEGNLQAKYEVTYLRGTGTPTSYSNTSTGRSGTIQSWTVPSTGTYKIECWGAQGGNNAATPSYVGGYGAYRYGQMDLTAGDQISIIVGQQGGTTASVQDGGGGGGTFVYKTAGADLLCAAGGGGGASNGGSGGRGEITTAGGRGYSDATNQTYGTAGTGGSGGSGGYAASGGGWLGNGGESGWSSGSSYSRPGSASKPGVTYVSGQSAYNGQAIGGEASGYNPPAAGGFGGGAGAHGNYIGGGGGGGYSGGAGGASGYGGGGGGSFVHASMSNVGGTAGARAGHGAVAISPVGVAQEVVSASSSHTFAAYTLTDETAYTLAVRVHDGNSWSSPSTVSISSDSWTYGSEVASAIQTGVDLPALAAGSYEAQVRTGDAVVGFGAWSASAAFTILPTSNVKIYQGGTWHTVPNRLRHQGSWVVPPNPERL